MNQSQLTFGYKLRKLREDKGLTQEQLAERIGITANAVGQFERGKIFPNYETIASIINVLDVDANLFFLGILSIILTKLNGLLNS